jgi:hypothetical protein
VVVSVSFIVGTCCICLCVLFLSCLHCLTRSLASTTLSRRDQCTHEPCRAHFWRIRSSACRYLVCRRYGVAGNSGVSSTLLRMPTRKAPQRNCFSHPASTHSSSLTHTRARAFTHAHAASQVDSHSKFMTHWDEAAVKIWKRTENE